VRVALGVSLAVQVADLLPVAVPLAELP
jgi:hypothetical protein